MFTLFYYIRGAERFKIKGGGSLTTAKTFLNIYYTILFYAYWCLLKLIQLPKLHIGEREREREREKEEERRLCV